MHVSFTATLGLKIATKKAKLTDSFKCEAQELYRIFVTEEVRGLHSNVDLKIV